MIQKLTGNNNDTAFCPGHKNRLMYTGCAVVHACFDKIFSFHLALSHKISNGEKGFSEF